MSNLAKRTENQILKNLKNDLESSMYFEKSLKYIEKNQIPYEEVFALVLTNEKSLKDFPLYLIYNGYIKNYSYIYNGISLPLYFDIYNTTFSENLLIKEGGKYILQNPDLSYFNDILIHVNDIDIIRIILKTNKKTIFNKINVKLKGESYSHDYINYLDMLLSCLRCNNIENAHSWQNDVVGYTKEDKINIQKIFDLILFDMDLTKEEIDKLLYGTTERNSFSLIGQIISNLDFDLFKKIYDKFGFDYEKSVPEDYSYHYIPLIPSLMIVRKDYYGNKKKEKEEYFKFLDFFIDKKYPLIPNEMKSQTYSGDVKMDSFMNRESCKGTISRGYYETISSFKKALNDEKTDDGYNKKRSLELVNYYIDKTDTLVDENHFWGLASITNDSLLEKLSLVNKEIGKEWTFEEIHTTLKNAIYSNKPELIKPIFEDDIENMKYLTKKLKYNNTLVISILQETERGIEGDKLFEFFRILLDYGYRINNHNDNEDFYEFFIIERLGIKNKLKELVKEYPNNYEHFIHFDTKKIGDTLKGTFGSTFDKPLNYIMVLSGELVRVLNEFDFDEVKGVYFDRIVDNEATFYCPQIEKEITFNLDILKGNEVFKEDFKLV